jgi:hypothetical protein
MGLEPRRQHETFAEVLGLFVGREAWTVSRQLE